jgi:hypothetical protein
MGEARWRTPPCSEQIGDRVDFERITVIVAALDDAQARALICLAFARLL